MNLKNIRILCSIDRQIKVKLGGGGEAYLDAGPCLDLKMEVVTSYAPERQWQPEGRSDTALTAPERYSRF